MPDPVEVEYQIEVQGDQFLSPVESDNMKNSADTVNILKPF